MLPCFSVSTQWQTATKRIVLCCGCVSLSFLAIVGFGLLQKTQGAENTLPARQVSAAPVKTQPKLLASYGKLPLSFEVNQGQTNARVRFLARGGGYTIFLTNDEAVLTLRKSSPSMSRLGKFGLPGRLEPFDPVDPRATRWPSLAGDLKSLWRSLIPDLSQMVPEPTAGKGGVAGEPESQPPQVVRMRLVGGNAKGRVVGLDELPGRSNFFIGNDPKKWRTNVPSYAQVKYEGVYPGVDLVYYPNQQQLEYDFVVAPGTDPDQVKLSFTGADGIRIDAASGDLVLKVGDDEVRFRKPAVYQPTVAAVDERRRRSQSAATAELDGTFVLASNNLVAFRVAGYDPKRALLIDPVLSYSTYLGGSGDDFGWGIAVDSSGNAYVTGGTDSTDFPTANPFQATCDGCAPYASGPDAFVAKLNAAGSALVYSTYLGGSGVDYGLGIAVDSSGNAYVTGQTSSTDFPTVNPFQATNHGGYDAFVAKLNAAGSALVYSTYLGGSNNDWDQGIAVDSSGNAYVTGQTSSTDFPTVNPFQATNKAAIGTTAFVSKLNSTGSALVYSTYLGGSSQDFGIGIAVDSSGDAYVTGYTYSTDFPTANALQATCDNCSLTAPDAFVAKLNSVGSALVYSTYLGGSGLDEGSGITVDSSGNAYVTGYTESTDFPTANPFQAHCDNCSGNNGDAFVAKLNSAGSALAYSTYLGGSSWDAGYGIVVDSSGNAYVTGQTDSTDFPTANPFQANYQANGDAFVAKLNAAGSALVYSTYLGSSLYEGWGIAVDSSGNTYVTGQTYSTDFPTVNPIQASYGGDGDAFVAKISPSAAGPWVSLSSLGLTFGPQNVGTTSEPQTETVTNTGTTSLTISTVTMGGTNANDFGKSADTCTGATVTPNGTCAVSVTFTPPATGSRSGSLNFTDNASGSPQTVSLTGTGVATAPVARVSPSSLTFINQNLGTTSTSQPVTLSNTGSGALTIASIATSANFGQTNNCGSSVAASGSCTINVTFSPNATGPLTGTLTITDNSNGVAGNTQSVALSGTGQDFTLAASSGSSTSATVAPGSRASYTLSAVGEGGFNQSVSFACTGTPSEATCTVSPNPVTAGSSASNVTVSVTTTAASVSVPRSRPLPPVPPLSPGLGGLCMLAPVLAVMAWTIMRRSQPGAGLWQSAMVPLALGLLLTLALAGCGGGGGGGATTTPSNPGTPAGTYTPTVTGTAGSGSSALSHSVKLTLTVS